MSEAAILLTDIAQAVALPPVLKQAVPTLSAVAVPWVAKPVATFAFDLIDAAKSPCLTGSLHNLTWGQLKVPASWQHAQPQLWQLCGLMGFKLLRVCVAAPGPVAACWVLAAPQSPSPMGDLNIYLSPLFPAISAVEDYLSREAISLLHQHFEALAI